MMTRGDGEPFVEEKYVVAGMVESRWVEGQEHGSACTCKIRAASVVGLIVMSCIIQLGVNN